MDIIVPKLADNTIQESPSYVCISIIPMVGISLRVTLIGLQKP